MHVLFLNPTFIEGLKAQGVDLSCCHDESTLSQYLTPPDLELIALQTTGVCKALGSVIRDDMIFTPIFDMVGVKGDVSDPYQFKTYGVSPLNLQATALSANTVILYADSAPDDPGRRTFDNILCALNLIMSASDVMELPLFGRIAHIL